MTLLLDPPILLAGGYAIGRRIDGPTVARVAGLTLAGAIFLPSVTTYLDMEFMRRAWEKLGARTGRDLILNSWVFSFDYEKRSPTRAMVVATIFASYPLWALAGARLGQRKRRASLPITG
jgi:hypothetical protein